MLLSILFAIIELVGVTGKELAARAFFDANNVKLGDPLVLTIDFLGEAEFRDLHPPSLANAVSRDEWKVDDISAKTCTYRDARRLTYRVRPKKVGLLWFPSLEFRYDGKLVKANAIPVHVREGAQVVVDEMAATGEDTFPKPPEIIPGTSKEFAWRKALAHPSSEAFAEFDSTEARMNEATCAINEGKWARALSIYYRLEWLIGQTPEIERGILAALSRKYDNPTAELPVWRTLLRPILRYPWPGRVGIVLGGVLAFALILWLLGRVIRALACWLLIGLLILPSTAVSQDIFQQMEEHMRQMQQRMHQMTKGSGFSFSFGGEDEREVPKVIASYEMKPAAVKVGEPFEFILCLEAPKTSSIGQISIRPSENFGLTFTGQAQNLTDAVAKNPTNAIKRISLPARYDVPFDGKLSFMVDGMISGRQQSGRGNGFFNFTFSNSFKSETAAKSIKVAPLPSAGQPPDFAGIISEGLRLHETCDILKVGTNDVVTITYRLYPKGYVPRNYLIPGAAYEWVRQNDSDGKPTVIEQKRYFVADGTAKTPKVSIAYYDPRTKSYKTVTTGGTRLTYVAEP